eukprot:6211081-Pleurochrysis_carterae.AAC.1
MWSGWNWRRASACSAEACSLQQAKGGAVAVESSADCMPSVVVARGIVGHAWGEGGAAAASLHNDLTPPDLRVGSTASTASGGRDTPGVGGLKSQGLLRERSRAVNRLALGRGECGGYSGGVMRTGGGSPGAGSAGDAKANADGVIKGPGGGNAGGDAGANGVEMATTMQLTCDCPECDWSDACAVGDTSTVHRYGRGATS